MNTSHNYSNFGREKNLNGLAVESDNDTELFPECLDDKTLRELINIPCAMFFTKTESAE